MNSCVPWLSYTIMICTHDPTAAWQKIALERCFPVVAYICYDRGKPKKIELIQLVSPKLNDASENNDGTPLCNVTSMG